MNENVTVREVMEREFVGVSESDDVLQTAELLLREDSEIAVVLRGTDPVGVVTDRDILAHVVGEGDPELATVEDVMAESVPTVAPQQTLPAARDKMSAWSTGCLVVSNGGEPDGVVTEHDILATSALGSEVTATESESVEPAMGDQLESASTAATDSESAAEDAFDDQGICELCGSLTRNLSAFNGQLLCADCRDM